MSMSDLNFFCEGSLIWNPAFNLPVLTSDNFETYLVWIRYSYGNYKTVEKFGFARYSNLNGWTIIDNDSDGEVLFWVPIRRPV